MVSRARKIKETRGIKGAQMHLPELFQEEYQAFLLEAGFDEADPQSLLMDLASLSMDVYLKEIAWLSDFLGRLEKNRHVA